MDKEKIRFTIKKGKEEADKCFIEIPKGKKVNLDVLANLFFWVGACIGSPIKKIDIELKN